MQEPIFVGKNAFDALLSTARLLDEYEFMSLGLSRSARMENGLYVLDDFVLQPCQVVRKSHVEASVTASPFLSSLRKEGVRVLGRAHSHGHFDVFYSDTDRRQLDMDIASFEGQRFDSFISAPLQQVKTNPDGSGSLYTLSPTYMGLEVPDALKIRDLEGLSLKVLTDRLKTVVGLTVNERGDTFGIRRSRHKHFLMDPHSCSFQPPVDAQDVQVHGSTLEYSMTVPVESVPDDLPPPDLDRIVEQVRSHITFDGPTPQAIRKVYSLPFEGDRTNSGAQSQLMSQTDASSSLEEAVSFNVIVPDVVSDGFVSSVCSHYSAALGSADCIKLASASANLSRVLESYQAHYSVRDEVVEEFSVLLDRFKRVKEEVKSNTASSLFERWVSLRDSSTATPSLLPSSSPLKEAITLRNSFYALGYSHLGDQVSTKVRRLRQEEGLCKDGLS